MDTTPDYRVTAERLNSIRWNHSSCSLSRLATGKGRERMPKTLDAASRLLGSLSPDVYLAVEVTAPGPAHFSQYALLTPEQVVLASSIGFRQVLCTVRKAEGAPYFSRCRSLEYKCFWRDGELLARCYSGTFDLTSTVPLLPRGLLVVPSDPGAVVCTQPSLEAVAFWSEEHSAEDLIVYRKAGTWTLADIGGQTYFLFAEHQVAPRGCLRALSMSKLLEQFKRFPKFRETLESIPNLWSGIQRACQKEMRPL